MDAKAFVKENYKTILLVVCFLLSPILTLPFVVYLFLKEKERPRLVFYSVLISGAMAFLALHTVPLESDDLYRHFQSMQILRYTPFTKIFEASYTGVYLNTLIMYFCGKTGIYGLYPALYVGVGYFLILYNMIRMKLHERNAVEIALILFFVFFSVNCRDFISGVRNYLAFIVCGYLIVSERLYGMDKRLCYCGIAVMGLVHTSAFIVLGILLVADHIKTKKLKIGTLCVMFLFIPVGILGCKVLMLNPTLANNEFILKIYSYLTNPGIINRNVYLFQIGILILAGLCHLINKRHMTSEYEKISGFFDYYLVFVIAVSPIMLLLSRFLYFLIPLMPIILMHTFRVLRKHTKLKLGFAVILLLFIGAGILMFLASIRAYPWNFDVNNIFFWLL